ncbi:hypothetical protein IQ226_20825 [Dolichospermum sp. LEGE 00240]|uniref:hypothetical protein n=1 Tax=Dolichospermum sp. LEGE 00240 TaxID=1828603 RepID=UPI00187EF4A8|nr:hypothetical protein [Dolichospermum sp. LEGE 00240]MBE9251527.1 hypothetical protein [Dolichospermum sp. LEGE 00240]MDM3852880.1 hypothetical protein [Aphanizomenon gracile PMC627.10]
MNYIVAIDTCAIIHLMYIERFYLLKALGFSTVITTIYVQLEFENGHSRSRDFFFNLTDKQEISQYPLQIEDLVEMANIPQSKKASDAELSCFVIAKRMGCKAMTDDQKACNYIQRHISMSPGSVINLVDIVLEAYSKYHLSDEDLRDIQKTLKENKFLIKMDLLYEGARRRLMTSTLVE